ncbi:uncharacterized protein KGF55_001990 [Candida pseudojiufengensis]|uniref:uncharacterized protein n=1 Tax=Candida pseudojiufengensis TaxID=497109 RepID=UPI0022259D20|nr:uncharacterized protein KGF55_001990 [Candida pseudojiufengensis]KAI5964048.1 hypothetical protein KGF55_001990 [Candida pseudojiufengensis]
MSKVFDNTENEVTKAPSKNVISNNQKFKRVPLGGKNTNTLNRSQSTIATIKPTLIKSNSTIPIFTESSSDEPKEELEQELKTEVEEISSNNNSVPIRKRISPVPELSPIKKQKLHQFETDSLIKSTFDRKPSISNLNQSPPPTELHASHIPRIYQNYMDPIKRQPRKSDIDELVEQHWKDEIEYIPQGPINADPEVFFSTPINSDNDLNFDDGEIEDTTEEIGLNIDDLKNLLD